MDLKDLADPIRITDDPTDQAPGSDRVPRPDGGDDRWTVIRSKLLNGEEILFVNDKKDLKAARHAHPGKVVYLPPETEELWGDRNRPDFATLVGAIHLVKKTFTGWIVPGGVSRFGSWRWR